MAKPQDDFEQAVAEAAADRHAEALLQDAVDATQNEIFAAAFGEDESVLDETGDTSVEAMGEGLEGEHVLGEQEETEEETETGETETGEGETETETGEAEAATGETEPAGRVPPGRLREATEARRIAEAERDALKAEQASWQKAIDAQNARIDRLLTEMARAPGAPKTATEQPAADSEPDVFEVGSKAYGDHLVKRITEQVVAPLQTQIANDRVTHSLQLASVRHGDTFKSAIDEIAKLDQNDPNNHRLIAELYNARDPGEAVVDWHRRNVTMREVGTDPAAYRERIAKETREALMKDPEFRKQLVEALQAEATGADGRPTSTTIKLPPSLNGARGGGRRDALDVAALDDSQQAIFDSGFISR